MSTVDGHRHISPTTKDEATGSEEVHEFEKHRTEKRLSSPSLKHGNPSTQHPGNAPVRNVFGCWAFCYP